jgi:hypothetical protein
MAEKIKKKLSKEEFLAMNETEREVWLAKEKKKFEYRFVNRYKQHSSYRIDFAPFFTICKQLKYKSITIEWIGFAFSLQINKLEKGELDFGAIRNPS